MKDQNLNQLRKELRQAGATSHEVSELLPVALQLKLLAAKPRSDREVLPPKPSRFRLWRPLSIGAMSLLVGGFLIIFSQSVSPVSWLYPVQKFGDSVAIKVHPQYRANVMMKRAQQVNSLVATHASSDKVLATLADYTNQAKVYKTMPHANYAAFEFCKTNLQQAATKATPREQQAIQASVQSLET